MIVAIFLSIIISIVLMCWAVHELLCNYRNPLPVFHNGDKRFGELLKHRNNKFKTRSILEDIDYVKN